MVKIFTVIHFSLATPSTYHLISWTLNSRSRKSSVLQKIFFYRLKNTINYTVDVLLKTNSGFVLIFFLNADSKANPYLPPRGTSPRSVDEIYLSTAPNCNCYSVPTMYKHYILKSNHIMTYKHYHPLNYFSHHFQTRIPKKV